MCRLPPRRIVTVLVSVLMSLNELRLTWRVVEYTPQSYVQSDLDMFAKQFCPDLVGVRPVTVSIDGGMYTVHILPSHT